jgi:hypothetical protein
MAKEVKMVVFILEHGAGYESEGILSRSQAEWEMGKMLSSGWSFMGAGGGAGAEDLGAIGMGFVLMSRDITKIDDTPLMKDID